MQSIGERLKQARLASGFSQRELARRAKPLSAMAVSRYERDEDVPGSDILLRLAKALGVKFEYFFRPVTVELTCLECRKKRGYSEKHLATIENRAKGELERYLAAEDVFGPEAFPPFRHPVASGTPIGSADDAEEAARRLRDEWALGEDPIEDLCEVLEDRGVKVMLIDAHRGLDGFTCWAERNGERTPAIGVRRDLEFGDRQRLSMAHELGHLLLRFPPQIAKAEREARAYRFAAAFLVPGSAARRQFPTPVPHLSVQVLYSLKHKWGVSMSAWARRLLDLGIVSQGTYRRFCMTFKRRRGPTGESWWDLEPGETQVKPDVPRRFQRLVEQAVAQDIISASKAAELLGKPLIEVRREMKWPQEAEAV